MSACRILGPLILVLLASACAGKGGEGERAGRAERELAQDIKQLLGEVSALRQESARLHEDVRSLRAEVAALKIEHATGAARPDPEEPEQVLVSVRSTPSAADVFVDGGYAGRTPAAIQCAPGQALELRVEKPGFRAVRRTLSPKRDTTLSIRLAPGPEKNEE